MGIIKILQDHLDKYVVAVQIMKHKEYLVFFALQIFKINLDILVIMKYHQCVNLPRRFPPPPP